MAGRKPHPERVNVAMARKAKELSKDRGGAFSQYIVLHYRSTGNLAPGCDARDFYAIYDSLQENPDESKH